MSTPSQLKIDNWGNFFMQRLNYLARKDEYCDYTIRSIADESFKVHRVVLNTCSGYFVSHPNTDTSMIMPGHLDFNAVKSVIMFMYTGELYFTEESRMNLLEVADMLQVSVLLKFLESQPEVKKSTSKVHSPMASTSRTHSAIALNQYKPAKKLVSNNLPVKSPPEHTPASTFINTMKVKDVLSENKLMRFECDAEDVPEFIKNTFELPKFDSAPLIKQENVDNAKVMFKRTSNGELIDKNNKTSPAKCDTFISSPTSNKKLNIISDADAENSKVVQDILKKFPHLLQSKSNIKLKIMSSSNQSEFESIIINTPNSVEKILPVGSDVKEPLTRHRVKPDIMNVKGPWSCNLCGTDANPLHLESYYMFRRHLVEKHNEKEDTRVCEHCGHFSVRKNLQIHHMYTKHNIQPPANFKFPKCDHCGFIATTDVHLKRHKTMEKCGSKPQASKPDVNYTCSECSRTFRSSLMLKGHMRNFHKIKEMTNSSTKELLISVIDNVPPGAKVLAENKSLVKIKEVVLNDEDVLKQTEDLKDEVMYTEETTEVETMTLEDAAQFVNENAKTSKDEHKKRYIRVNCNNLLSIEPFPADKKNYVCSFCNNYETNRFDRLKFHMDSHKYENTSMNKTFLASKKSSKSKRSASSSSSSSSKDDSSIFKKQKNTMTKNTGFKKIKRKDGTNFDETDGDILFADGYLYGSDLNKDTDIDRKNQEELDTKDKHKNGYLRVNYNKLLSVKPFPVDKKNNVFHNYVCSFCNNYKTNRYNRLKFHMDSHKNGNTSMNKTFLTGRNF